MLNVDSRTKSKLSWLGVMILPVIAVQGVRLVFASSATPANAGASVVPTAPNAPTPGTPVALAAKPLSAEQKAAMQWLRDRTVASDLRSPFDRPDPAPPRVEPTPTTEVAGPAPIQPEGVPRMTISSIIADSGTEVGIVSINHKLYRLGDEIAKDWKLVEINSRQRSVRVRHADGREIELTPAMPQLNESTSR